MEDYECGGSCSIPFLQVWKGGIKPVHDTIDDAAVFAGIARAFTDRSSQKIVGRDEKNGTRTAYSPGNSSRYSRSKFSDPSSKRRVRDTPGRNPGSLPSKNCCR